MRLLVLIAACVLASAAGAQPAAPTTAPAPGSAADPAADARAKLLAADANKDGKWDKAEWIAAGRRERGFDFLDADKDGFVTQAELKTGMEKLRAMGMSPQ